MSFAPVLVETGGPHAGPPAAPSCSTATGTIEIALGAAVVRVGPGTDLATLTKVLRAVQHDFDSGGRSGSGGDEACDFRRGADSLAGLAKEELQRDPFSGTILVFRSKRADRLNNLGQTLASCLVPGFSWSGLRLNCLGWEVHALQMNS